MTIVNHIFVLAFLILVQACTCKPYTTTENEIIFLATDDEVVAFALMDVDELLGLSELAYLKQQQYWVASMDEIQVVADTSYGYEMKFLVSSRTPGSSIQPGISKGKHRLYIGDQLAHEYDLDSGKVVVDRLEELNYLGQLKLDTGYPWWWWARDYSIDADLTLDYPGYEYDGEKLYVSYYSTGQVGHIRSFIGFRFPPSTPDETRVSYEIPFTVNKSQYVVNFSASFKERTGDCEFEISGIPGTP